MTHNSGFQTTTHDAHQSTMANLVADCMNIAEVMASHYDGDTFEKSDIREFSAYKRQLSDCSNSDLVFWTTVSLFHLLRWATNNNKMKTIQDYKTMTVTFVGQNDKSKSHSHTAETPSQIVDWLHSLPRHTQASTTEETKLRYAETAWEWSGTKVAADTDAWTFLDGLQQADIITITFNN